MRYNSLTVSFSVVSGAKSDHLHQSGLSGLKSTVSDSIRRHLPLLQVSRDEFIEIETMEA